jgi:hypothetical protein
MWMFNQSFEEKVAEQRKILEEVLPAGEAAGRGLAIDLGAAPGFQAIALEKSSYVKLRLAPAWVTQHLIDAGFSISVEKPVGRLQLIAARKP